MIHESSAKGDEPTMSGRSERSGHSDATDLSYATVANYCSFADRFKTLATCQNDLKDVQRPWAIKTLLEQLPPPARVLEIGGGEPMVSSQLVKLGYDVTLCDPFDGSGHGPTDFDTYRKRYPEVHFRRACYTPDVAKQDIDDPFDAIFSVSVLEHVPEPALSDLFQAIQMGLRDGGVSMHCVDIVVAGNGTDYHVQQLEQILQHQWRIGGICHPDKRAGDLVAGMLARCMTDLETFFLSPQGHNLWRGATPYTEFPFRKVISAQSIIKRSVQ